MFGYTQNWGSSKTFLLRLKRGLSLGIPFPRDILARLVWSWELLLSKRTLGKKLGSLKGLHVLRILPIADSGQFFILHFKAARSDNQAEIIYLLDTKLAFSQFQMDPGHGESLQYQTHVLLVPFSVLLYMRMS